MSSDLLFASVRPLLETPQPATLGPGPRPGVLPVETLNRRLEALLAQTPRTRAAQDAMRGLVLLWHDHLAAAHALVRGLENPDGRLLHGIMHRREPDYGNAKYWFRRAGSHRCYPPLAERLTAALAEAGEPELNRRLFPRGVWDPFGFVDLCEAAASLTPDHPRVARLQEVQRLEFEVLAEHWCGAAEGAG